MNVAFLLFNYKLSGGMRVINELSNGLVDRGHNVYIVVPKGSADLKLPVRAKIIEGGRRISNHYLSAVVNLPLLVASVPKCDAVICTFSVTAYPALVAAKIRGAVPYNYIQNHELPLLDGLIRSKALLKIYRMITSIGYRLPLKMLVNSRWTAEMTGLRQYSVIHPCVDRRIFNKNGTARDRAAGPPTILAVAKKQPWKGFADLLCALDIVYERMDFNLVLLAPDGAACNRPYLGRVLRVENDNELAEQYRQAHLFVSPSWFEGFGLPPLEAMACGTPVVLTDSGGVREYAVDGFNCLMVPPRRPEKLAQAVVSVLTDDALSKKIAAGGIDTAQKFQWSDSVDKLEQILLADASRKGTPYGGLPGPERK